MSTGHRVINSSSGIHTVWLDRKSCKNIVGLVYCAFMADRFASMSAGNSINVNNRSALRNTAGNLEFIANKDLAGRQCKTSLAGRLSHTCREAEGEGESIYAICSCFSFHIHSHIWIIQDPQGPWLCLYERRNNGRQQVLLHDYATHDAWDGTISQLAREFDRPAPWQYDWLI